MLANREWSQYAIRRAPLRVSIPSAGQRSTYFLQLPYTFSIPLLLGSVLLHWYISQSIFLTRIAMYKDGEVTEITDRLTNYQHVGKASDEVLSGAIVGVVVVVGYGVTYSKGVPVGGTNSTVISAAYYVRYRDGRSEGKDDDLASQSLQWGVTIPGGRNMVGHCCFSSGEVEEPVVGHLYAGGMSRTKRR
ncbi:hypothetical protein BU23DRAFT_532046 [Bimuria novae-zelandiae CBS 107.79]|uniref:Uncharacterized protein n=1 Tax=Bimuria novae-zelandiae CBS 107.79 TaxID=1447943 RepID=A0A6A5VM43_9PLEO|nr:hypothetical protein BU23DRAFT_532046 [Bimuria novae-zelandiae CBS 107.79]